MKEELYADAVIVGGGASGLAAAIELKTRCHEMSVTILEKNAEPGRKIRATGSGRCNISNTGAAGYNEVMAFFTRIGLVTRTYENGLVYPYSESAADVADLLCERAEELGVHIITEAAVTGISVAPENRKINDAGKSPAVFDTCFDRKGSGKSSIRSGFLILACGGKAGPMFGTTGDGYAIARSLGHSIVTPVPVLTPVECREWAEGHSPAGIRLAGTRTRGEVSLYKRIASSGELSEIFRETGEIQFTRTGLSGICVFNMTRHMRYDRRSGESLSDFVIKADLFPEGDIKRFLESRRANAFPGEKASGILRTVLKENIAEYVVETAGGISSCNHLGDKPVAGLSDSDICVLAETVHSLSFHPENIRGWKEAQATSGGVSLEEIDLETGESRIIPGLYITGELADRDFMCGGFNLNNAWLTGIKAAGSITALQ